MFTSFRSCFYSCPQCKYNVSYHLISSKLRPNLCRRLKFHGWLELVSKTPSLYLEKRPIGSKHWSWRTYSESRPRVNAWSSITPQALTWSLPENTIHIFLKRDSYHVTSGGGQPWTTQQSLTVMPSQTVWALSGIGKSGTFWLRRCRYLMCMEAFLSACRGRCNKAK